MKRKLIDVLVALFILLFVYTATTKLQEQGSLEFVLRKYPLIGSFSRIISYLLPITEYIVAVLLFFPKTKRLGVIAFTIMMSAFTVYTAYMLLFSPKLPCTCGGILQSLSWPAHLVFNICSVALAIFTLILMRQEARSGKTDPRSLSINMRGS